MNNSYDETLDANFIQAWNFYGLKHSYEELIEILKSDDKDNVMRKQIAALKLETLKSKEDAKIFLSNLTGIDGKVREAVSFKLSEFFQNGISPELFKDKDNCKIFLNAINDINGNVCRSVVSTISNFVDDEEFSGYFCPELVKLTLSLIDIVEKFDFQDGKYKVNKEAFKLYWCLETVDVFCENIDFADLKKIILRAKNIKEYTIREKAAKILTRDFEDEELIQAKIELKNDPNYYVRNFR